MDHLRLGDVLMGVGVLAVLAVPLTRRSGRNQRSVQPSMLLGPVTRAALEAFGLFPSVSPGVCA